MGIEKKLALRREQYGLLYKAGEAFLALQEPTMDDVENYILTRERCVLTLQAEPILTAEHSRWRDLARGASAPADAEEEATAQAYAEGKALNQKVLNQDQAVLMRLRWLKRKHAGTPEPEPARRKAEAYTEQPGAQTGRIYDRLR
ncbi:MAG: hypothetical protein LBS10_07460 [Gracilibacteraceae bacterium]|jgi:hypothetical protein|nr:hypothetical protein [Gracilibacteraceae bacterium]